MMSSLSRPLFLGLFLALAPTITSAGGQPPAASSPYGLQSCAHSTPYEVRLLSGAGPFAPANDPFVKHPLVPKLSYNFLNTGAAIPHLVLVVDSRGSFTPGKATATINTGHSRYRPSIRLISSAGSISTWDFGPLPAGAEELIHVPMHLKRQCCYMAFLHTYANLDRSGRPDQQSAINGGFSGGGGSTR